MLDTTMEAQPMKTPPRTPVRSYYDAPTAARGGMLSPASNPAVSFVDWVPGMSVEQPSLELETATEIDQLVLSSPLGCRVTSPQAGLLRDYDDTFIDALSLDEASGMIDVKSLEEDYRFWKQDAEDDEV